MSFCCREDRAGGKIREGQSADEGYRDGVVLSLREGSVMGLD
jgi:hypothetical protein